MNIQYNEIKHIVPQCCEIGFADIDELSSSDKSTLTEFFPQAKTIIVLGHHIQESIEWVWFKFEAERRNNTCAADLHSKLVIENLTYELEKRGFTNYIVLYPGICGIIFKSLAIKTGMGQLGDSHMFLHPIWGPWVHLRVMLTNAKIKKRKYNFDEICNHCGACIKSCPAKAISIDSFNGLLCNETQMKYDKLHHSSKGYIYKCEMCVRVCPIGIAPKEISIEYKNGTI